MKRLLVPIDFSSNSLNALSYANELYEKLKKIGHDDILITIFHSYIASYRTPFQSIESIQKHEIDAYNEAKIKLDNFLNKFSDQSKSLDLDVIEIQLKLGLAIENIIFFAEKMQIDLIIMGTKGAGNLSTKLFGTNTACIIDNVQSPVFAIPQNSKSIKYEKIALAIEDENVRIDPILLELIRSFNAEVHLLHIIQDKDIFNFDTKLIEKIKNQYNYSNFYLHIIESDSLIHGLKYFVNSNNVDFLAMKIHERNPFQKMFHPSVTKEFSELAVLPIFAYH